MTRHISDSDRKALAVAIPHRSVCGDAIDLISLVNVIIPQSRRCWGRDRSLWPGSAQCPNSHKRVVLRSHVIAATNDYRVCRYELLCSTLIRHNHSSIEKWIWLKITRSAGLRPFRSGKVIASSNQLPQRMLQWLCWAETHSIETSTTHTPLKVIVTESSEEHLGQSFCKACNPKVTSKYPSLDISGYVYSARGEPLTSPPSLRSVTSTMLRRKK